LPIVTSIISALGFISTTVMAWRKEKRDEGVAQLELERQRIELEKVKLELEQQKKELDRRNGA
jgi:transposase-like protein